MKLPIIFSGTIFCQRQRSGKKWSNTKKNSLRTSYLKLVTLALVTTPPNMSVSDMKAVLICGNEASDMNQWSTSVVVVPSGPPMRCLRRDMVTDLVFEVWVMVSQGHIHHHPHEVEGGAKRSIFDISSKSPMVATVAAEASYVM